MGARETLKRAWDAWRRLTERELPPDAPPEPWAPNLDTFGRVSQEAMAWASSQREGPDRAAAWKKLFPMAQVPAWVPKHEDVQLAMDDALSNIYGYASSGWFGEGVFWPGFPYLAELTQRPEYRIASEVRAKEMTRKWITLTYDGKTTQTAKLKQLEDAIHQFALRKKFGLGALQDGFFGRSALYFDTGVNDNPTELKKPLPISPKKIAKGGLKGFRVIEPMWMYPGAYNSDNPLRADFFVPPEWYVMGKTVSATRLRIFNSRPLPDILKPAYSFAGLSTTQIMKPYVDWWLRDRNSVSDLITNFSIVILMTKMATQAMPAGNTGTLAQRAEFFNLTRSNRGLMLADKDSEEVKNIAVPLGTLDQLQAQSQEHMSMPTQIPLVKLWGVTPSGLNASSDGEIRVFYDTVTSWQEDEFRAPLKDAIDAIQCHLWGTIDPAFDFIFPSLWQLDEAAQSAVRKSDADTAAVYIDAGVLRPEEQREALAADPASPYAGLDPSDVPEPPEDEDGGETGGNPAKSAEPKSVEGSGV